MAVDTSGGFLLLPYVELKMHVSPKHECLGPRLGWFTSIDMSA